MILFVVRELLLLRYPLLSAKLEELRIVLKKESFFGTRLLSFQIVLEQIVVHSLVSLKLAIVRWANPNSK